MIAESVKYHEWKEEQNKKDKDKATSGNQGKVKVQKQQKQAADEDNDNVDSSSTVPTRHANLTDRELRQTDNQSDSGNEESNDHDDDENNRNSSQRMRKRDMVKQGVGWFVKSLVTIGNTIDSRIDETITQNESNSKSKSKRNSKLKMGNFGYNGNSLIRKNSDDSSNSDWLSDDSSDERARKGRISASYGDSDEFDAKFDDNLFDLRPITKELIQDNEILDIIIQSNDKLIYEFKDLNIQSVFIALLRRMSYLIRHERRKRKKENKSSRSIVIGIAVSQKSVEFRLKVLFVELVNNKEYENANIVLEYGLPKLKNDKQSQYVSMQAKKMKQRNNNKKHQDTHDIRIALNVLLEQCTEKYARKLAQDTIKAIKALE